ncbi:MAG: type I 3-dehydroquinate dehydratase [Thermodesulfovibrionales bacterium]|nr:type I 3-dehydroquinate dehydratase [Thermodesulfovibrionales bacterium]
MRSKPLIVASLTDTDVVKDTIEIVSLADVVELRVDMFERRNLKEIENTFIKAVSLFKKHIIGTVRDISEGGLFEFRDRLTVYLTIARYCSYVDIEISHEYLIRAFKQNYSGEGIKIIASYHNFSETPDDLYLQELLTKSINVGANITKIAVLPNKPDDVERMLKFTETNRDKHIITLCMGELGRDSRVTAGLYGSIMTYGYVAQKTAPGQIYIPELRREIDSLYVSA